MIFFESTGQPATPKSVSHALACWGLAQEERASPQVPSWASLTRSFVRWGSSGSCVGVMVKAWNSHCSQFLRSWLSHSQALLTVVNS